MRTLTIGTRKTKDLTEQELVDFMYQFGYCCSDKCFHAPVITKFEYDEMFGGLFFDYYQIRKEDGFKIEDKGQIYLTDHKNTSEKNACCIYLERFKNFNFTIYDISHFLKLGFDLPL